MAQEINEIKITVPEGMEIDRENSTFECIKFKKREVTWRDKKDKHIGGFEINKGHIIHFSDTSSPFERDNCRDIFATEKQAKSALAMAQISQIMANDERFGGVITDEEWTNDNMCKMVIIRCSNDINFTTVYRAYNFLAFHTVKQRDLFLKENEDLIKDYLMID